MPAQPHATIRRIAPSRVAGTILIVLAMTIAGAFAFQAAGFAPCELCLKERLPYYAGLVLAAVTLAATWRAWPLASRLGFAALAALFLFSAGLATYHAGVEWGFWPGPSECTGAVARASTSADFLNQLQNVKVVRCDAVAIRILGLSLAGWNALVSLGVTALAVTGSRGAR